MEIKSDPYRQACLAIFLDVPQEEIEPIGYGNLYRVRGNEGEEYALLRRPSDVYCDYVGRVGMYHVYKLGGNSYE